MLYSYSNLYSTAIKESLKVITTQQILVHIFLMFLAYHIYTCMYVSKSHCIYSCILLAKSLYNADRHTRLTVFLKSFNLNVTRK